MKSTDPKPRKFIDKDNPEKGNDSWMSAFDSVRAEPEQTDEEWRKEFFGEEDDDGDASDLGDLDLNNDD
jgi:hypothetical protein